MTNSERSACNNILLCAVPPTMAIALVVIFWLWPDFYLQFILERRRREFQAVELVTVFSGLAGFILLMIAAVAWCRRRSMANALVAGIVGLATLFFVGEEISWGQTYLKWKTPREYRPYSNETNLHNTDLPVHTLANGFIISVFFVFPLAWRFRDRTGLPSSLEPIVPTAPVIAWAATAFIWKESKRVHRTLSGDESDAAWYPFFEQINEQKEMFIAIALMHYGAMCAYRLRPGRAC